MDTLLCRGDIDVLRTQTTRRHGKFRESASMKDIVMDSTSGGTLRPRKMNDPPYIGSSRYLSRHSDKAAVTRKVRSCENCRKFITEMMDFIADELSKIAIEWQALYDQDPNLLDTTKFTFVIHRRHDVENSTQHL